MIGGSEVNRPKVYHYAFVPPPYPSDEHTCWHIVHHHLTTVIVVFVMIACVHFSVSPLEFFTTLYTAIRYERHARRRRGGVGGKTSIGGVSAPCLSPSPWSLVARECSPSDVFDIVVVIIHNTYVSGRVSRIIRVCPCVHVGPVQSLSAESKTFFFFFLTLLQSSRHRRLRWSQKVSPTRVFRTVIILLS